ncbi:MAG TPA: carboxypeptidase-like regulatory domain-containing protein, partial [Bacteroidia bacterium]|nr:carboxypeptidase-like regulatory domain-containing protein [Bacteroidia bacterium]
RAEIVLLKRDNIISFQAQEGKDLVLSNGAGVKFNPRTIKNSNGALHTGNVRVSIVHIDPADENFSRMIPGGDLRAFTMDGDEVQLYSYGMLNIELHDDAGNLLNLADNTFATLTFPVPATMLANAPAAIPLWYFDENKGIWIEAGSAELKNNKYIGYVSHFTTYNVDVRSGPSRPNPTPPPPRPTPPRPTPTPTPPPPPPATITGKLTDCKGKAIPYGKVRVGQTTTITDADGNFSRLMPLGDYTVDVYDDILNKFIGINKAISLTVSNTTVNAGVIAKPCRALISGRIKDCDNTNFSGYAQIKCQNKNIISIITDGWLRAEVPAGGADAAISFYKLYTEVLHTKSIVLPPTVNDEINLGSLKVCYEGIVYNKAKLNFNYRHDTSATEIFVNFGTFKLAEAGLVSTEWLTKVKFVDSLRLQDSVVISFSGEGKGLREADWVYPGNPQNPTIIIYLGSENLRMQSIATIINVQEYGDPGGWVAGAFSGRFNFRAAFLSDPNTLPNTLSSVDVNGVFAAQRIPDRW